ncbi:MAG TPA: fibrinogen-binding protein, partial [Pirellulales bacterium]
NGDGRLDPSDRSLDFSHMPGLPVAGDFNGDGVDEVGVFHNGKWHVDTNNDGKLDHLDEVFEHGAVGDQPVVGDWDADGKDDPGVYRPGVKPRA